jgi:hypothetical protein
VQCFLEQTHPCRRLLILNHGESLGWELPGVSEIAVQRPPTLGELRNLAFEYLCPGDYAITWDDDDWHAPNRMHYQLANLLASGKRATALTSYINVDIRTGKCFVRSCRSFKCGACCGLILWRVGQERYPSLERSEDSQFALDFKARGQLHACLGPATLYLRLCHGGNTSGTDNLMRVRTGRRGLVAEERAFVRHVLQHYVAAGAIASVPTILASR